MYIYIYLLYCIIYILYILQGTQNGTPLDTLWRVKLFPNS